MTIFVHNKRRLFFVPPHYKNYSLSVLVPAYNEEKTIADTIEHIFASDYNGLKEVIVINDGSKDNTLKVIKALEKKYSKLVVIDKPNSGKASSLNYALPFATGEFVAIIDADSYLDEKAFSYLMGYFKDKQVGVVTATCTPRNRNNFLERLQTIEYKVIAFTRKLLEYIESIYVAPGSTSIYRKEALLDIGGFDPKNMTEDIESTWHVLKNGWKIRMCLSANVMTTVPSNFKSWWTQRIRWTIGGLQVLKKYFKYIFSHGIFGYFVIPFFALGLSLGVIGMSIFAYLFFGKLLRLFTVWLYKFSTNVSVINLSEINVTPSLLNYFGVVLFILFFIFTMFVLAVMRDKFLRRERIIDLVFYLTLYLLIYPFILIKSIYQWAKGELRWR